MEVPRNHQEHRQQGESHHLLFPKNVPQSGPRKGKSYGLGKPAWKYFYVVHLGGPPLTVAPKRVLSRHPLRGLLRGLYSWHTSSKIVNANQDLSCPSPYYTVTI